MPDSPVAQFAAASSMAADDLLHMVDVDASGVKDRGLSLTVLGNSLNQAWVSSEAIAFSSAGNTNVTPGTSSHGHWVVASVTTAGSSYTRTVSLLTAGRATGDVVHIQFNMPTSAHPLIEVRNSTSGGTLLATIVGEADGVNLIFVAEFDGSAWQPIFCEYQE